MHIFKKGVIFSVVIFMLLALQTIAATQEAETQNFFKLLQQRLIADGFKSEKIKALYANKAVAFEVKGVSLYFQHNEATLDYAKMTEPSWIDLAKAYKAEHIEALKKADKTYGVDPDVIIAIILVETKFGRFLGTRSIINTLSTMASLTDPEQREYLWNQLPVENRFERNQYDQKADRKSQWAYNELKAFLTYTEQHQMDPVGIKGSYAGAIGIAQFMPSNILAYGQDGDEDGRIDLFNDTDAIASIASYLKYYGWKPGIKRNKAYKVVYHYNHSKYYVNTILKITELLKG